jgi:hypothetical protein
VAAADDRAGVRAPALILAAPVAAAATRGAFVMTSLKVGDLVELRAGTGTVGTDLDVVVRGCL